jgi:hypothetical protein
LAPSASAGRNGVFPELAVDRLRHQPADLQQSTEVDDNRPQDRPIADSKLFNVRSLATGVVGLDLAEAPLGMHSMGK